MKLMELLTSGVLYVGNIRSFFKTLDMAVLITVMVKTSLVTGGSERIAFSIVRMTYAIRIR